MAAITAQQIIVQTARILRRGRGESETQIYDDWLKALLPTAAINLALKVADDKQRRPLLYKQLSDIALTNGEAALPEGTFRQLLTSRMQFSTCYDLSATDEVTQRVAHQMVFKANHEPVSDGRSYLDPNFAYYALRNNTIVTRGKGGERFVTGPLQLSASYIPDFSADYPLPYELVNDQIGELIAVTGLAPVPHA
jgi:hypothetical protein